MAQFFLCYNYGGTDFEVSSSPYDSAEARLEDARKVWAGVYGGFNSDSDNLFWLNIEDGVPTMGSFLLSDFDNEEL